MFKNLKTYFTIIFGFQLILICILVILIFTLYKNQNNLSKSRDTHFNSYLLADELRQSSDDLTRLVRSYVAMGNPEFEREYWAVLDIRNGKIPRPENYERIYWDFVSATGQEPRPGGEIISLQDLMIKEGFTEAEFNKLDLAQKNSDGLVKVETIAMNAVKGLFDDGTGHFTIQGDPDLEMANRIMNDENYYKIKAEIMQPIDNFYVMFGERTTASVSKYLRIALNLFWSIIVLVIFIMSIFLYSFVVVRRQIVQWEKIQNQLSDLNKGLEQKIKERTRVLEKAMENLEKTNKFMTGRELKMIELKKEIQKLKGENENQK